MRARAASATTPIRAALIALLLSACAGIQPFVPDTARLRPETFGFGVLSADVYAVQQAQWAFADPSRTHGRPLEAARASAAMDYIAGQLNTSPRWANISAITKMQLLEGREEVRRALGVRPGVSSQAVVDTLAGISNALIAGDHHRLASQHRGVEVRAHLRGAGRAGDGPIVEHALPAHGERLDHARGQ